MRPPFALYPEAHAWWSVDDYAALLDLVRRLQPKTVLEFGPGGSTLALVEGGAQRVDTCENDPEWLAHYQARLDPHRQIVTFHAYAHTESLTIPALDDRRFDLGFIDGPRNTETRWSAIQYALARCTWVACHDGLSWPIVTALREAAATGRSVELLHYNRNPGEPEALGIIGPCCRS
jgi:hypothetical protein